MPEMSRTGRNRSFPAIFPSTRSSRTAVHLSGSRGIRLQRGYPSASEFPDRSRSGTRASKPDRRTRSHRSGKRTKREIFPDAPSAPDFRGEFGRNYSPGTDYIFIFVPEKTNTIIQRRYRNRMPPESRSQTTEERKSPGTVPIRIRGVPGHRRPGRSGSWFLREYRSI